METLLSVFSHLHCSNDIVLVIQRLQSLCSLLEDVSKKVIRAPVSNLLSFLLHLLREFIIDGLSVERNHVLVRVSVVGGPSERKLPPRALQEVSYALLFICNLVLNWYSLWFLSTCEVVFVQKETQIRCVLFIGVEF